MNELKCDKCDKEFSSQQSFDDHNRSKHYVEERKSLKLSLNNKYLWIFIGIVIIFLFLWLSPIGSSNSEGDNKFDSFALCLTDKGAKMYGAYWCPHCQDQKEEFGNSWKYINYIECSLPNRAGQTQVCKDAGIDGYPTWEFNDGLRKSEVVSLEELSRTTGCSLTETDNSLNDSNNINGDDK